MEKFDLICANSLFSYYEESPVLIENSNINLFYTEAVSTVAFEIDCFWFLELIANSQNSKSLKNQPFQFWELEREFIFTEVNSIKIIDSKKDSFNVFCKDERGNVLFKKHIVFSEFAYDLFKLFYSNNILYLPFGY